MWPGVGWPRGFRRAVRAGECSAASTAPSPRSGAGSAVRGRMVQPCPIGPATKSSITATASGRRAAISRPRCRTGIRAASQSSAQTSRARRARSHVRGCPWPVTVTKPKLRIEAPLACASRSTTATRSPARAPARACASPTIPPPTTSRSKRVVSVISAAAAGRGGGTASRPRHSARRHCRSPRRRPPPHRPRSLRASPARCRPSARDRARHPAPVA